VSYIKVWHLREAPYSKWEALAATAYLSRASLLKHSPTIF